MTHSQTTNNPFSRLALEVFHSREAFVRTIDIDRSIRIIEREREKVIMRKRGRKSRMGEKAECDNRVDETN